MFVLDLVVDLLQHKLADDTNCVLRRFFNGTTVRRMVWYLVRTWNTLLSFNMCVL